MLIARRYNMRRSHVGIVDFFNQSNTGLAVGSHMT